MSTERSAVVETFMNIVQIDSPTFHEEKMTKHVFDRLTALGLSPEIDKEGNVLAYFPGDPKKETFMINAHLDTVQAEGDHVEPYIDKDGWIRSKGNTILGADNKTAVAAILETLDKLVSEKSKDHHPLEIVFTVSEESGSHGAHGLNYKKITAKRGYIFDAGGRDFGEMIISSPAYARFDLKIIGKGAHASRPELGINVLPIFAKAFLNTRVGKVNERTRVNFGVVSVGKVDGPVNTVPGEIIVSGEVRSMDEKEMAKTCKAIVENFEKEAKAAGAKIESKIVRENGSFEFFPKDSFIIRTLEVLKQFGIKPKLVRSWGCYEANIFAEHGIKMLNISDGSLDSHALTERIKASDLERLVDLIYFLVKQ